MNKKIPLGAALAFMVVVAAITFCITMMISTDYFNTKVLNVKSREEQYKKLADLDAKVRQNYNGEINQDTLNDALGVGYINGITDKYASYMNKTEYENYLLEQRGRIVSIGIVLERDSTGYAKIKSIQSNSPASDLKLTKGQIIIKIDNADTKTLSLVDATALLKGDPGTKVNLTIRKDGVDSVVTVQRKSFETQYVTSKLVDNVGYIKLNDFNQSSAIQFRATVEAFVKGNVDGIIIDLRNVGNSDLSAATLMLNTITPAGSLGTVVSKDGTTKTAGTSDAYDLNIPITVLVNNKTNCSAEYFAAAVKDFNKGTLVGTKTYGKSEIQEIIALTDGSAVNITTEKFLTSKGVDLSGVGITPDYEVKLTTEQEQQFETLDEKTDPQIKKAIEIVKSKIAQ